MDITYDIDELKVRYNVRVGAIITWNNKILIQQNRENPYYVLIGGRVHYMETSEEAMLREVEEETGVKLQKDDIKLIDVVENFFLHTNGKYHEQLFIYKIEDNAELLKMDNFQTKDSDHKSINKWYPINELGNIDLRPKIVRKLLDQESLTHEINVEYE